MCLEDGVCAYYRYFVVWKMARRARRNVKSAAPRRVGMTIPENAATAVQKAVEIKALSRRAGLGATDQRPVARSRVAARVPERSHPAKLLGGTP